MKKRFSLKKKFILIFGILIAAAGVIEIVLAVMIARRAVTEKIEDHCNRARKLGKILHIE